MSPAPAQTLVLLDTNAYLRLAKRVRPMLGVKFGQKNYELTILKDVEEEVRNSPRLLFHFPWFETDRELREERMARRIRLTPEERDSLDAAASVLHGFVLQDVTHYMQHGRNPPGLTDCRVLAFGQLRNAVVVTDDLGVHELAVEFRIAKWHGFELVAKMRTAKLITDEDVREIFSWLEVNGDLTATWRDARQTTFARVFRAPRAGK